MAINVTMGLLDFKVDLLRDILMASNFLIFQFLKVTYPFRLRKEYLKLIACCDFYWSGVKNFIYARFIKGLSYFSCKI